jgi:hypothetical protein
MVASAQVRVTADGASDQTGRGRASSRLPDPVRVDTPPVRVDTTLSAWTPRTRPSGPCGRRADTRSDAAVSTPATGAGCPDPADRGGWTLPRSVVEGVADALGPSRRWATTAATRAAGVLSGFGS